MSTARLGKKLARYRRSAKMGQAEAARRVGIDKSSISRIEKDRRGARIPSEVLVHALATVYGLSSAQVEELQRLRRHELLRA